MLRIKDTEQKKRGISINNRGELCLHKIYLSNYSPNYYSCYEKYSYHKLISCIHHPTKTKQLLLNFNN